MKNAPRRGLGGFTLIELLVVVLIIGILVGVALPQYTRAVEKSRLAAALPLLDSVYKAQLAYYLANGSYAESLDQLDIEIPWTETRCRGLCNTIQSNWTISVRSNADWSLISGVRKEASELMVALVRTSPPSYQYSGAGIAKYPQKAGNAEPGILYCMERSDLADTDDYCKIGGYSTRAGSFGGWWSFYLPN